MHSETIKFVSPTSFDTSVPSSKTT